MENKQEYILCAAIKRIERKNCKPYYDGKNDICDIEIGYRHHDIFQRFPGEVSKRSCDQGFYTSKGRFVDRSEAMFLAWKAKQVSTEIAFGGNIDYVRNFVERSSDDLLFNYIYPLYSENLY